MKITFPPDHPAEAGPARNSRLYEAFPVVLPLFTYLLILWCCVVHYLLNSIDAGDPVAFSEMLYKLGLPVYADSYSDPMWKLLTGCFVHLSFMHIAFNMMWLFQLGPLMERGIGTMKTILFVVATGFVSSAIATGIEGPGVGMSGVVYALGGFMWTAWPRWTGFLERFNGWTIKLMIFWQLICFIITLTSAMNIGNAMSIGNVAHISGMAYGAVIGKWACAGNERGKPWMLATVGFTLVGVAFAFRPLGGWLGF